MINSILRPSPIALMRRARMRINIACIMLLSIFAFAAIAPFIYAPHDDLRPVMHATDHQGWGMHDCVEDEYYLDGDCIHPDALNDRDIIRFRNMTY